MRNKITVHDRDQLEELTAQEKQELADLANLPDDSIDTSDLPELTAEQFRGAIRGQFYRPVKAQITARLDADVLAWLKAAGKGYQSRMNAILRREMLADVEQPRRKGRSVR